jgi:hypothetical protein
MFKIRYMWLGKLSWLRITQTGPHAPTLSSPTGHLRFGSYVFTSRSSLRAALPTSAPQFCVLHRGWNWVLAGTGTDPPPPRPFCLDENKSGLWRGQSRGSYFITLSCRLNCNIFTILEWCVPRWIYSACGLVARVPGYTTEMYCVSCEVRTEFIYVM